jgi:uncharacterized iron-regulated membrane protein
MGHRIKRWLYLTHRWIGIVTCLFIAMWFASGLVMLYVPFPDLAGEEWLEGQRPIAWEQVAVGPRDVADGLPGARSLTLEMRGDVPVWRIRGADGSTLTLRAADGRQAVRMREPEARHIASMFGGAPVAGAKLIHNDQWSVPGGYDADRPLWKVSLANPEEQIVYVSSRSGAVVLDTAKRERFWNWLGSIPHWLYPRALREMPEAWRQVVMWVSGPCIIGALSGLWIGVLRIRPGRRRFSRNRMTPYAGWMKWHHVAGLAGGFFLLTWIFSGWLSVDPGRFFASGGVSEEARAAYDGDARFAAIDMKRLARLAPAARRVEFARAAGRMFVRVEQPGTAERHLDAATLAPYALDEAALRDRARELVPGARHVVTERLTAPDAYWYSVGTAVPLPVLRFKFDDAARTWVHVDPATGEMLGGIDSRGRLYRWLFDGLHRWDFGPLLRHDPARQLWIWLLSLVGLVLSVTSIWIAWRRLRRPARITGHSQPSNG